MEIKVEENRIVGCDNGAVLATLSYTENNNVYEILGVVVDVSLRGQGVGGQLMNEMCNLLVEKNATCIPTCSYAKHYLESKNQNNLIHKD